MSLARNPLSVGGPNLPIASRPRGNELCERIWTRFDGSLRLLTSLTLEHLRRTHAEKGHAMRPLFIALLIALSACTLHAAEPNAPPAKPGVTGLWLGVMQVGPVHLRMAFEIKATGKGAISGRLISLDQSHAEVPCESFSFDCQQAHRRDAGDLGEIYWQACRRWKVHCRRVCSARQSSGTKSQANRQAPDSQSASASQETLSLPRGGGQLYERGCKD